jgi:tRNA modification GTPase
MSIKCVNEHLHSSNVTAAIDTIETIAAIATPAGHGGVGIVRISGPKARAIAEQLTQKQLTPRYAHYAHFAKRDGEVCDQGIALYFQAPHSFTGEDIVELHGHGGVIILNAVLTEVLALGARMAHPGEFSERAFLNNKIDLIQAEAICDIISAQSTQSALSAVRSLQGLFSQQIQKFLEKLIRVRVLVEANIDFSDEQIEFLTPTEQFEQLNRLQHHLEDIFLKAHHGSRLSEGITVVIAGKPNVGKSTLLNQLCGLDVAIVSDVAGTTRDLLTNHLNIDGIPIKLIDTAGIHETTDSVEQEGIRRAFNAMREADVVLYLRDCRAGNESSDSGNSDGNTDSDSDFIEFKNMLHAQCSNIAEDKMIVVSNKIDLISATEKINKTGKIVEVMLSAKNNKGVHLLRDHLKELLGVTHSSEGVFSARTRHVQALTEAKNYLVNAIQCVENNSGFELVAEELRQCQLALNKITGDYTSDDLLGEIFSTFCIGK